MKCLIDERKLIFLGQLCRLHGNSAIRQIFLIRLVYSKLGVEHFIPLRFIRLFNCFYGVWDPSNYLETELASNLPQKLRQIVGYCTKTEPPTSEKMNLNTFVKNYDFIVDLKETA